MTTDGPPRRAGEPKEPGAPPEEPAPPTVPEIDPANSPIEIPNGEPLPELPDDRPFDSAGPF
jgi:hypothetical protein